MSFFNVDNVVKNSGSSAGTINTTFSAVDLAFDYLAAGEHLNITYVVQLDDHAGGVSTQNVQVTVVGTNDKPFYLSGPETAHLIEGQNVNSSGNLHATGDLLFTDVDLSDTHTVATTVTAARSGGGAIPLTNAQLLAAFTTALTPNSTGHLLGDVDWHFALNNSASSFLAAGETLTLTYHLAVTDPSAASDSQDVTITILGTNHPVVITSGAGIRLGVGTRGHHRLGRDRHHHDGAGRNAGLHRRRHRRYPHRCDVTVVDLGTCRSGCNAGGSGRGAEHHAAQFHRHR